VKGSRGGREGREGVLETVDLVGMRKTVPNSSCFNSFGVNPPSRPLRPPREEILI